MAGAGNVVRPAEVSETGNGSPAKELVMVVGFGKGGSPVSWQEEAILAG